MTIIELFNDCKRAQEVLAPTLHRFHLAVAGYQDYDRLEIAVTETAAFRMTPMDVWEPSELGEAVKKTGVPFFIFCGVVVIRSAPMAIGFVFA